MCLTASPYARGSISSFDCLDHNHGVEWKERRKLHFPKTLTISLALTTSITQPFRVLARIHSLQCNCARDVFQLGACNGATHSEWWAWGRTFLSGWKMTWVWLRNVQCSCCLFRYFLSIMVWTWINMQAFHFAVCVTNSWQSERKMIAFQFAERARVWFEWKMQHLQLEIEMTYWFTGKCW